jgi:hypothetical protein
MEYKKKYGQVRRFTIPLNIVSFLKTTIRFTDFDWLIVSVLFTLSSECSYLIFSILITSLTLPFGFRGCGVQLSLSCGSYKDRP